MSYFLNTHHNNVINKAIKTFNCLINHVVNLVINLLGTDFNY